ncbi:class 1 fructose-bisphosphatase [Thermoproteota archaeon]
MNNIPTFLRTHFSTNNVEHELRRVMSHLAECAKYISAEIMRSNRNKAGSTNGYGEQQLALDVWADKRILDLLRAEQSFGMRQFVSEEQDEIIEVHSEGRGIGTNYSMTVDPLDGSSLVDVNLSIGTIIGIHRGDLLDGRPARETMAAAMYMLYGPATTLVYSAGDGVHEFVIDPAGNWALKQKGITMRSEGKIYCPGGNKIDWTPEHAKFIDNIESQGYKLRYSGALVADFNQILMKGGGIFTYPALEGKPEGKLRLLMELQPLSFIVEQAGGRATDGIEDILDKVPEKLDQRSPIYIGSQKEVSLAKKYLSADRK